MKSKRIYIRVSEEEEIEIRKKARQAGMNISEYLRTSALAKEIVVNNNKEELKEILRQLSAIGNNLNQATMLAHQGKITSLELEDTRKQLLLIYKELIGSKIRLK